MVMKQIFNLGLVRRQAPPCSHLIVLIFLLIVAVGVSNWQNYWLRRALEEKLADLPRSENSQPESTSSAETVSPLPTSVLSDVSSGSESGIWRDPAGRFQLSYPAGVKAKYSDVRDKNAGVNLWLTDPITNQINFLIVIQPSKEESVDQALERLIQQAKDAFDNWSAEPVTTQSWGNVTAKGYRFKVKVSGRVSAGEDWMIQSPQGDVWHVGVIYPSTKSAGIYGDWVKQILASWQWRTAD